MQPAIASVLLLASIGTGMQHPERWPGVLFRTQHGTREAWGLSRQHVTSAAGWRRRGSLRLRGGGRMDEEGMPELIGLGSREGLYQPARGQIGRLLDTLEPFHNYTPLPANRSNASQPMFRARLRGDWRGPPLVFGKDEEMFTRAGAAKRYNFWTTGKLPWTQWTEYEFNHEGEIVKSLNLTQRKEWDERYGIGGHPGWLGWGGRTLREYAQWLREKDSPTIVDQIAVRERLERDTFGWPLIFTDPFQEEDALRALHNFTDPQLNPFDDDILAPVASDTHTPAPDPDAAAAPPTLRDSLQAGLDR